MLKELTFVGHLVFWGCATVLITYLAPLVGKALGLEGIDSMVFGLCFAYVSAYLTGKWL